MQNTHRFRFFSLAGILAAWFLLTPSKPITAYEISRTRYDGPQQDYLIAGSKQASPCMALLLEAASKTGVKGILQNSEDTNYGDGFYRCYVQYVVSSENGSDATKTSFGLTGSQSTIEKSCEYTPQAQFTLTTFHGYNAQTYYRKGETRLVNDMPYTYERKDLDWCMYKGDRSYHLSVGTDTQSIEIYGPAQDPLPIADVLWSLAEDRLPLSEEAAHPAQPGEPGEIAPGQPGVPADSGGQYEVPLAIILGSLGVPILGAFFGAALSAILSALSSTGVSPTDIYAAGDRLVNAGQQLVEPIETSVRLAGLNVSLEEINQELLNRNIYVANPLQGDPVLMFDGLTKGGNWVWDKTIGWVTKSNGLTCEGYVDETFTKVQNVVHTQFGPEARVQRVKFEEKSTAAPEQSWWHPIDKSLDWLDSRNEDNHDLIKVILLDGSEWAVDFHQHNTGKRPPILRPWNEAKKVWQDYMGDEFTERISVK